MQCLAVVVLNMYSLDLAQQHAWRMENGHQTQGRFIAKVKYIRLSIVFISCNGIIIIIIAIDCGRPSINFNVNAIYDTTLLDSRMLLTCADGLLPSGIPIAQCYSNGSWIPNPANFTCKSISNPEQGAKIF